MDVLLTGLVIVAGLRKEGKGKRSQTRFHVFFLARPPLRLAADSTRVAGEPKGGDRRQTGRSRHGTRSERRVRRNEFGVDLARSLYIEGVIGSALPCERRVELALIEIHTNLVLYLGWTPATVHLRQR